jgi:hypothetical protein
VVMFSDKHLVRRTRPIWSRWVAFASLAVSLLALASPAQAVDATGIGNRFKDSLDTRYSAYTMANYTKAMGYAAYNYQIGTTADNAWDEGKLTSVFGLYGHANAGVFLVDDNRSPNPRHWFMAGNTSDLTHLYRQSDYYRQITEYLPVSDVDDMKLMILAGCYTANTSPFGWGNFNTAATARGVDSVVTFPGLVYSPSTSSTTPLSETNYSGNYFWHRFFYHSNTGVTVGTASLGPATTCTRRKAPTRVGTSTSSAAPQPTRQG